MSSLAGRDWFEKPALKRIFTLLNADGGEVRIVGGAVRNALMDLPVVDVDMATTLTPDVVVARARAAGIEALADHEKQDLSDALRDARHRQAKALAEAGEEGLKYVPALLRGAVRKVVGL